MEMQVKKYLIQIILIMIFTGANSLSFATQTYPDVLIKPFPIMTWVPPALTEKQIGWYKEAGFNVMFIRLDEEAYQKLKKYWNGNWILFGGWNPKDYNYIKMCDFHAEDPNRIGFLLGDEPNVSEIDEYVEQYSYLRSKHPNNICIVNAFPSYVSQTRLGGTFRFYIDKYFEKLNPRYSSLDHYPCNRFNNDSSSYYHDLEIMRETAKNYNSKVFGFVQLYSSNTFRDISESDLAWQVNSLLAYGCKGLWYFYFRHPIPGINELTGKETLKTKKYETAINFSKGRIEEEYYSDIYHFGSGVLNENDEKGERFDDVVKLNHEVLAWSDIILDLNLLYVRHVRGFEEGFVPVGTDEFANQEWHGAQEKYIAEIKADSPEKSMGYIVSYFENKTKKPYVMIVNKRHGEFMSRNGGLLKTVVTFTKDIKNAYLISNRTSKEEKIKLNNTNSFEMSIGGGGAILLRLQL